MSGPFDEFSNGDGTYNGVALLSRISGLSMAEVYWTANRLKHLLKVEKRTKDEAKSIVREEAKSRPWEAVSL